MDAPLENRTQEVEERGALSLRSLSSALGRLPIWLVTWFALFVLSLIVALPWYDWFHDNVGQRYAPGQVTGYLDETFRLDHKDGLALLNEATAQIAAVLAFVSMLLGVFFAGGWLQVILERTRGHSLRRFFYGGSRYFPRFFRVLLLTLCVLALIGWVVYGTPFQAWVLEGQFGLEGKLRGKFDELDSESTAFALRLGQDLVYALCVSLTLTWAEYTRTRMALQNTYSALWGGLTTFFTMLRHPFLTLRPMVVLLVAEALVLFGLAWLGQWVGDGFLGEDGASAGVGRVWVLLVLVQLGLMWRSVIQGARYHVTVGVSQAIVRPLMRPDPWKESIGGPGGPRYPLEEGDEYGVAL
ncbi:MAG: hypothetical protein H6828_03520 [Planctomycetes bacterium]|nr:hypothetical protein [Planctomycetota bacterium]